MDDDNTSKDQTETKRLIHPSQFQPSSKTSDLEMPTEPFQATSSSRDEGAPSSPETPPATEPQLDNENHDDTLFSSPKSHHSTDPTDLIPLQPFDWPSLESRFTKCMEEKTQEEEDVRQELGELMNVRLCHAMLLTSTLMRRLAQFYQVWAETPTVKEDERCTKR